MIKTRKTILGLLSALQRHIQPLFLFFPAGIFGLRSLLNSVRLGLDGLGFFRMVSLGVVKRRLRLVDSLPPTLTSPPAFVHLLRYKTLSIARSLPQSRPTRRQTDMCPSNVAGRR
jgi:hypothetical protein